MILTIHRPQLTIKGHYTPPSRMYNRKTSAQYKILETMPKVDAGKIEITAKEWSDLEEMYFLKG